MQRLSLTSTALLSLSHATSIAYARPIHTTVTAFATCAFLIVSASKAVPKLFSSAQTKPSYTALPLDDLSADTASTESLAKDGVSQGHQGRVRLSILAAGIGALSIRLELYRQVSKKTECTISSVEIFLPLLIALYDAMRLQKREGIGLSDKLDGSVYDMLQDTAKRYVVGPRFRYVLSTFCFCLGCRLLLSEWLPLNSTYICPVVLNQHTIIPRMQACCLLLDFVIAIVVYEMLPRSDGTGLSPRRSVVLWSSTFTGTALIWSIVALIVYIAKPEYRFWLLLFDSSSFFGLLISMMLQALLFSILCITALHSVGILVSWSDFH
jgi:hypothetical protein